MDDATTSRPLLEFLKRRFASAIRNGDARTATRLRAELDRLLNGTAAATLATGSGAATGGLGPSTKGAFSLSCPDLIRASIFPALARRAHRSAGPARPRRDQSNAPGTRRGPRRARQAGGPSVGGAPQRGRAWPAAQQVEWNRPPTR